MSKQVFIIDEDHVMRHVPHKKLIRDEDGNPIGGFFPEAFKLRPATKLKPAEKNLSVNWLEYFNGNHEENIKRSIQKFRDTREIGKNSKCGYGTALVKIIKGVCDEHGAIKVRILLNESPNNKSHSSISSLPKDNDALYEALAVVAFENCVLNSEV